MMRLLPQVNGQVAVRNKTRTTREATRDPAAAAQGPGRPVDGVRTKRRRKRTRRPALAAVDAGDAAAAAVAQVVESEEEVEGLDEGREEALQDGSDGRSSAREEEEEEEEGEDAAAGVVVVALDRKSLRGTCNSRCQFRV